MSMNATSLNASVVPNKGNISRNFRTNYARGNNNSGGNNNFSGNNFYQDSSSGRNALICELCKRPGHTRDRCYKIHCYPSSNNKAPNYNNQPYRQSNQKFKGNEVIANVHGGPADAMSINFANGCSNANITNEQYGQIMDLIQHFQNENIEENSNTNTSNANANSMNFAVKRPRVIGNFKDGLYFLCAKCLKTPDSVTVGPICCCLSNNSHIDFPVTVRSDNFVATKPFHETTCKISTDDISSQVFPSSLICTSTASNENLLFDNKSRVTAKDSVDLLWHNRLGYVPFVKTRTISTLPANFSPKQPFLCTICPMARQERLSFKQSSSQTNTKFELFHVDLWGPYHEPTYDNYKYFITLVNDYIQ
ncbi:hypothetical protein KY290_002115 [Solanum tuberosum]|uniref:Uncharacterized protein n=1 Tax=Solanum tuberosum TaxID=4113 RepID=A0ABQ7WP50_SOLTU|nr:hypothetical protein KY284_002153 [Solanum tuberosum]KAH0731087.1 hypothetical protein KY289_002275 [Solanum tuberosum]KAH0782517.1 hypothetical protein KY290_002115 [Solanum tuberosum]